MKRITLTLLVLIVMMAGFPASAQDDDEAPWRGIVDTGGAPLVLRSEPRRDESTKIGKLPKGSEIQVWGLDAQWKHWFYVTYQPENGSEMRGWVWRYYIWLPDPDILGNPIDPLDLPLLSSDDVNVSAPTNYAVSANEGAAADDEDAETTTGTTASAPVNVAQGAITVEIGNNFMSGDDKVHEVQLIVTNHSVSAGLSTGRYYLWKNPDGGTQWVTKLKAALRGDLPFPLVGDAPLWRAEVTLNTGETITAYAGCRYVYNLVGRGFEPTAEGGFYWEQTFEGAWFDCGNDYTSPTIAEGEVMVGETVMIPLYVYGVNPHAQAPYPKNYATKLALYFTTLDGQEIGPVIVDVPRPAGA